jgi:hypothetical protein
MGWTINYIIWGLSAKQLILLSEAAKEIYEKDSDRKNGTIRLEDLSEKQQEQEIEKIFGISIGGEKLGNR